MRVPLLIEQYGWSDALRLAFEPHARAGYLPGLIIVHQREANLVFTDLGNVSARLSGRLRHEAREAGYPAAGDWVALSATASEGTAILNSVSSPGGSSSVDTGAAWAASPAGATPPAAR